MGEVLQAIPLIREIAVGAGSVSVVFAIYHFWIFITVKENKKTALENKQCIKDHQENLISLKSSLIPLKDGQARVEKKLDKLIDLHLNGKN